MALQVGEDLSWLRPATPEEAGIAPGQPGTPTTIGTHRGSSAALCVRNPVPGRVYYFSRNPQYHNPSQVQLLLNDGWQFIRSDDVERWGAELPPEVQKDLGGLRAFKDVVLMWTPIENYQKLTQAKQELANAHIQRGDREYLNRGYQHERALGDRTRGLPVYYTRRDHGVRVEEYR